MTQSKIALTNLGQYNEGRLNYVWLNVPCTDDELKKALKDIEVANGTEYEEYFITDWEYIEGIGEYSSIKEVNKIAEKQQLINEKIDLLGNIAVSREDISKAINSVLNDQLGYKEHDIDDVERVLDDMNFYISSNYIDGRGFECLWTSEDEYFQTVLLENDEKLQELSESELYNFFDEKGYTENQIRFDDSVKHWEENIIITLH